MVRRPPIRPATGRRDERAPLTRTALAAALALALLPSLALGAASNGTIVYGPGSAASAPAARPYTVSNNLLGAAVTLPSGAAGQTFFVEKASPMNIGELLAGYVTTAGELYVLRYDGTTWTSQWSAIVGGDGVNGRRFDIAYERSSGRGLVVYSGNASNAALRYRVWDPAAKTWSAEQTFSSARLAGQANWVKLASGPSNQIAVGVVDASSYPTAFVWSGSGWGNEPGYALSSNPVYYKTTIGDCDAFDLAWSTNSGDLMVAWGAANVLRYNRFSSGSWLGSTASITPASGFGTYLEGHQVVLAADPRSDRLGLTYTGVGLAANLGALIWSGTAWSSHVFFGNYNTFASDGPHLREFSPVWLTSTTGYPALVVPFADATATTGSISYGVAYPNSTGTDWTSAYGAVTVTWPWATGTAQKVWFQAVPDLGYPSQGLVAFADSKGSLWAKKVNVAGGGAGARPTVDFNSAEGGSALTTTLASTTTQSFAFDYVTPRTILGDNSGSEATTNASGCPGKPATIDLFTLSTTGGTDQVTGMYVTLTSGREAVQSLSVGDSYGDSCGSAVETPAGSGVYYLTCTNAYLYSYFTVTSTPTLFGLSVTPKSSAQLPAGPTSFTIAGRVSRVVAGNPIAGADSGNGSVVVLHATPPAPVWVGTSAQPGQALLNWSNSGSGYANTVILRSTSASPITTGSLTDGTAYAVGSTLGTPADTIVYSGNGTSFTDNSGNAGGTYYYRAFNADACNDYSPGATTAAALLVPQVPNPTTPVSLVATANSCRSVTVTASFTGDGNGNGTASFYRDGNPTAVTCLPATRTPPVGSTVGGNNGTWTCVDAVPSASASYVYTAKLQDADNGAGWTGGLTAAPVVETPCSGSSNGLVAFSPGATSTTPSGARYAGQGTSNAFGAPAPLPAGAANQTFVVVKASPTSGEYLAGYVTTAGVLYVLRYDGTRWTSEWSAAVGGDGVNGRRFDIAYEKLSGRAVVVYSGNSASSYALRYRLWNPTTGHWGTEQAFGTAQLYGTILWVKAASRGQSNQVAVGVSDTNGMLTALLWDGTSWGNEPSYLLNYAAKENRTPPLLSSVVTGDLDAFDLTFTGLSGDLILAWTGTDLAGYGNLYSNRFQAASQSWLPGTEDWYGMRSGYNTSSGALWQVVVAADPTSDRAAVAVHRHAGTGWSGSTLELRVWTGSTWLPYYLQNGNPIQCTWALTSSLGTVSPHQRPFTAFWLNATGDSEVVVPYSASSAVGQVNYARLPYSAVTSFTPTTACPTAPAVSAASVTWPQGSSDSKVWFQGVVDPGSPDRALVLFSDTQNDLWAKRVVLSPGVTPSFTWSDAEGTPPLTRSLASITSQNFAFDYDHPPVTVLGDNNGLEAVTGAPACAGTATGSALYDLDHFTLATSANSWPSGTDKVTKVTARVSTGNAAVGTLYVTSDTGAVLGSLGYQASGAYAIPVSIPVTTTPAQYRLQVKPALAAALPAGATYPIAASVVNIAAGNPSGGADPSSGSVLVDRVPPAPPAWGTGTASPGQVALAWTNPTTDFASAVVLRSASGRPLATSALVDGSGYAAGQAVGTDAVAYAGSGTGATDLSGAGTFLYRAFAADACNNYSAGATLAAPASPPAIPGPTAVAGLVASASSCTAVTLTASFTGDGDGDNTASFTRDGVPVACASLTRKAVGASGTWTCTDSVPSADATYAYAVQLSDPDGFSGTNPATATLVQAACPASGGTLALGLHPQGASPEVIANPGQTNVLAGRFSLTASAAGAGGSVSLAQLAIASAGTALPSDVAALGVYADVGSTAGAWDAGDQLVGTATFSRSSNTWICSGFDVPLGTTSYLVTVTPAYGATPGHILALSLSSASLVAAPGISVVGSQAVTGGTVTLAGVPVGRRPGDATPGSQKPMVLILNPSSGATVSLDAGTPSRGVRFQVQVHDPSRTAIGSVLLSHDGGSTFPDALALNPSYDVVTNPSGPPYYAHVYQADLTTIPPGTWTLQAMATTTGGGAGYSAPVTVTIGPKGTGDGNLLVRNDSSQLCIDCHALQGHTSQSVSAASGVSKYGSWATSCRDCHAPHQTRNAQLLSESVVPPAYSTYQTSRPVRFWDRATGDSGSANAMSFVSSAPPAGGALGPCQACHTRTGGAVARWRNSGNADAHFTGASTQPCTSCHSHATGFGGLESRGGQGCATCHTSKFWNMQAQGAPDPATPHLTRHTLGSIAGTNDSPANPSLAWTSPLSANPPASRSCVGMCHGDHVHNDPGAWPASSHAGNLYADGTTQASRALTRDGSLGSTTYGFATSGAVTSTDFTSGQYGKGCLACHSSPVDGGHPAVSGAAYDASAHNVTVTPAGLPWEYALHDGARFTRNCTKCHAGTQAEGQVTSYRGAVQGVHYSDNPSLLAGAVRPAGNAASNVCYNCHGNGVVGVNNSNRDIASELAKTGSSHPVNADAVHDTAAEAALTWGNALGWNSAASRHAGCLDCHDPHAAKQTLSDTRTLASPTNGNVAGPALAGATGARLTYTQSWTAPTAASFVAVSSLTPGVDLEATLCFKCHSSFYWGNDPSKIPVSPSGGFPETDVAKEFSPANASFHPVLAKAPDPTNNILKPWTTTSLMRCTDCHNSETSTDPDGPHGSGARFLLKGPNTDWNSNILMDDARSNTGRYKIFCANCHDVVTFINSKSWAHVQDRWGHQNVKCFTCHAAIPHGGYRPGLLVAAGGSSSGPATSFDAAPYFQGGGLSWTPAGSVTGLYIQSVPSAGSPWTDCNCECYTSGQSLYIHPVTCP
ncbi:cytochrome c3 family protein [Anaeromyxobacter paludicola]|uniref:Uncharacterized protein n=1 Tax=Anaeromyxobacter paludicola TaxID=2918171 RepID=A0ABN6N6Q1_9BACT|nr:cytochrome c3 family protein [Anaeromyxobacter paludicola]BDG08846.1 hypothetical protein AMPC_19590 [Anaeromyxobacter paludicola]